LRFFCSDALLRALLPEAAAAPPAGRGAEPAAEQPPRARFHSRHGSGNRRADTGMPGRARFKRTLLVPKPALARLLGNGRQPVRVGPTRRHSRGVAVRLCAWGRETAPSRAASEAITRRKTSRAATLTAASQLGFRGNDVQMMFCSCLAVCLLLQHPSQCEYLVPTRTKKSLQSYTALGKLLLLLTAPSAHRQKLPRGFPGGGHLSLLSLAALALGWAHLPRPAAISRLSLRDGALQRQRLQDVGKGSPALRVLREGGKSRRPTASCSALCPSCRFWRRTVPALGTGNESGTRAAPPPRSLSSVRTSCRPGSADGRRVRAPTQRGWQGGGRPRSAVR